VRAKRDSKLFHNFGYTLHPGAPAVAPAYITGASRDPANRARTFLAVTGGKTRIGRYTWQDIIEMEPAWNA
jgi:hypothetical protein